jgi:hypothetical protein
MKRVDVRRTDLCATIKLDFFSAFQVWSCADPFLLHPRVRVFPILSLRVVAA